MTTNLRIRYVDPRTLTPAPYNPRQPLTGQEKERLRASLLEFGFVEPILVNTRTDWVVGGHQRLAIAIEERTAGNKDFAKVPIVERDLDPQQEKVLNVLLNNPNAQGRYDEPALAEILTEVEDTPLLELAGFDYDDYTALLARSRLEVNEGREGRTPPPPKTPKTKPGEVWQLGRHLLYVGDATDPASYRHLPEPAAMTFTDPPYNVDYKGGTADELKILNDRWESEAYYSRFLEHALTQAGNNTDGAVYCCYAINHAAAVHAAYDNASLHISTTIAWVKDRFVLGRSDYHWQWEAILYGWPIRVGAERYWVGDRNQGNVWEHASPKRSDRGRKGPSDVWRHQRPAASALHPTMKPVSLCEQAIRNSSPAGGWVLDPFGGSGSTLIAAENIGRNCYMIELDPAYADVIIARYESLDAGTVTKGAP